MLKCLNDKMNNAGISILLAILVLTSLMIVTIVISDLVLRIGRSSRQIGYAEVAYYAAETGVEKALYKIEKERNITTIETSGTLSEFNDQADWEVDVETIEADNPYVINLAANEQFQLELDFTGVSIPNSLNVNWSGTGRVIALYKDFSQEIFDTSDSISTNNISFLKIINNDTQAKNFTLTTGGSNLPLGIRLNVTGEYNEQLRNLRVDRTNWQIY